MDLGNFHIPLPLALAVVAAIGYLIGRNKRTLPDDIVKRSLLELKRARMVATELEKITLTVRKSLSQHNSSVLKFKERVNRMGKLHQETAWKELCREADEILKPTLQLASQIANAYDEIRQQSAKLMSFTEVRTDPLTGIKNRRGMDDAFAAQFALFTRYDTPFSVAIFDIDNFKGQRSAFAICTATLAGSRQAPFRPIRETDIRRGLAAKSSSSSCRKPIRWHLRTPP
jgi:hypothetical protein